MAQLQEQKAPQHCQFWLPRKARFCSAMALPNFAFCGNHKPPDVKIRIPCPIDPSHTILQAELEAHSRKCPALMRLQQLEEMQYHKKGVNAGTDNEDVGCADHQEHCCCILQNAETMEGNVQGRDATCQEEIIGQQKEMVNREFMFRDANQRKGYCSSKMKRTISNSLSEQEFKELVRKIESAYDLHCKGEIESAFQQPPACNKWVNAEADRRIPFQEKHVVQQASLLGNVESFGLLQPPDFVSKKSMNEAHSPVYVEFGAGRGYLAHMLADCYKVQSLVLVERRSYKFKADRTLRQNAAVSLERLRIDIEDLDLRGVKSLQGRHYVALSKHLCGYATDLTLRCCYSNLNHGHSRKGLCSRFKAKNEVESHESLTMPLLDGLAIATCCHHLCQWKPYVSEFHNLC